VQTHEDRKQASKLLLTQKMTNRSTYIKVFFVVSVAVLIILNLYTFILAYPESQTLTPGINSSGSILAKDFSAYYIGAWRLWNNPSHVYTLGALKDGEPTVLPQPEAYKYLPSFLLLASPLLALNYQQALLVFNIFQFALLPLMAFLLFRLLGKKGVLLTFVIMAIALLQPFPTPKWGFSASYYWQWGEGQAKVIETFLLLLSFYFGFQRRPYLSGIVLAFGFFDPRFGLLALPLFIMYNWKNLKASISSFLAVLFLSNSMLLFTGAGSNFLNMVSSQALTTPLYYYSLIPLFTLLSLIAVNFKEMTAGFGYRINPSSKSSRRQKRLD
jgi:hypothetical protein